MNYRNVLIVDDSSTSRMIIQKCLEISGLEESIFFEAENGLEGLDLLKETAIDLVISDLNMPKMDGQNFIRKVRETNSKVPIIVISSKVNSLSDEELQKSGVNFIMKKPVSPTKISEALESLDSMKEKK